MPAEQRRGLGDDERGEERDDEADGHDPLPRRAARRPSGRAIRDQRRVEREVARGEHDSPDEDADEGALDDGVPGEVGHDGIGPGPEDRVTRREEPAEERECDERDRRGAHDRPDVDSRPVAVMVRPRSGSPRSAESGQAATLSGTARACASGSSRQRRRRPRRARERDHPAGVAQHDRQARSPRRRAHAMAHGWRRNRATPPHEQPRRQHDEGQGDSDVALGPRQGRPGADAEGTEHRRPAGPARLRPVSRRGRTRRGRPVRLVRWVLGVRWVRSVEVRPRRSPGRSPPRRREWGAVGLVGAGTVFSSRRWAGRPARGCRGRTARSSAPVVPGRVGSAAIEPPWSSQTQLAMASPRPVPPAESLARSRSGRRPARRGPPGCRVPRRRTWSHHVSPSTARAVTTTLARAGLCRSALSRRFASDLGEARGVRDDGEVGRGARRA